MKITKNYEELKSNIERWGKIVLKKSQKISSYMMYAKLTATVIILLTTIHVFEHEKIKKQNTNFKFPKTENEFEQIVQAQ